MQSTVKLKKHINLQKSILFQKLIIDGKNKDNISIISLFDKGLASSKLY